MPAVAIKVEFTPVTPRSGGLVHATTLFESPGTTVCGKKFRGWIVALKRLDCQACKAKMHKSVRLGVKAVHP